MAQSNTLDVEHSTPVEDVIFDSDNDEVVFSEMFMATAVDRCRFRSG